MMISFSGSGSIPKASALESILWWKFDPRQLNLIPNFSVLLPCQSGTTVSLETKPFISNNIFLSSPRNHLLSLAVTFQRMTNIL